MPDAKPEAMSDEELRIEIAALKRERDEAFTKLNWWREQFPDWCYRCESPCKYAGQDKRNGALRCADCLLKDTIKERDEAQAELAEIGGCLDWGAINDPHQPEVTTLSEVRRIVTSLAERMGRCNNLRVERDAFMFERDEAYARGWSECRESCCEEFESGLNGTPWPQKDVERWIRKCRALTPPCEACPCCGAVLTPTDEGAACEVCGAYTPPSAGEGEEENVAKSWRNKRRAPQV